METMFSGRHQLTPGEEEKIPFVDRDPAAFSKVISFLRNNQRIGRFDGPAEEDQFYLELEFWGMKPKEE